MTSILDRWHAVCVLVTDRPCERERHGDSGVVERVRTAVRRHGTRGLSVLAPATERHTELLRALVVGETVTGERAAHRHCAVRRQHCAGRAESSTQRCDSYLERTPPANLHPT